MATEPTRPRSARIRSGVVRTPWLAACVSAALLLGIAMDGRARDPAIDTTAYHQRVSDAAETLFPLRIGDWVGTVQPTPPAAVALLHPNVLLNRQYRNAKTGEAVTMLFVHCSDARDLVGHYPPVCYPANGLTAGSVEPRDWTIEGVPIEAMRYRFVDARLSNPSEMVVDNFMVLPRGTTARDMYSVQMVAKDRRQRVYGAAEVQVVSNGAMGDERRNEVFRLLVGSALPLIATLKVEASRD